MDDEEAEDEEQQQQLEEPEVTTQVIEYLEIYCRRYCFVFLRLDRQLGNLEVVFEQKQKWLINQQL